MELKRDSKGRFAKGTIPFTFLNLDKEKILKLYCKDKISPIKIAGIFECSITPIYQILNENNAISKDVLLKVRKEIPPSNKINFSVEKIKGIINLYSNEKNSVEKISKILKIGTAPIRRILKENRIKKPHQKYYLDEKEIVESYKILKSSRKVAQKYNYNQKSILKILRKNNVDYSKHKKENPRKGLTLEEFYGEERGKNVRKKMKEHRATQIFPLKDSSIEIKIQNFLKEIGIEHITHFYVKNIELRYRCDIFIPSMNLVIECDGDYWHGNPIRYFKKELNEYQIKQRQKDELRSKQLLEKGYKIIRLWEHEINNMTIKQFEKKIENVNK